MSKKEARQRSVKVVDQKTAAFYRSAGWRIARVQHFNVFSKTNHDLFGFADFIAMKPRTGICLVQATTKQHVPARVKKILQLPQALEWLLAGGTITVFGWYQDKKNRWQHKVKEITVEMFRESILTEE